MINIISSGLQRLAQVSNRLISHDGLALWCRLSVAAIFWLSGRTKVTGWLDISDSAILLFETEYQLPGVPPLWGAHMAAYAEHFFPILLVLGLATRFGALALLGMTAVIQIFVYPQAWPTHLSWAVIMLYLITRGGGRWSLDRQLNWT
jgi:putative oxidoreductase